MATSQRAAPNALANFYLGPFYMLGPVLLHEDVPVRMVQDRIMRGTYSEEVGSPGYITLPTGMNVPLAFTSGGPLTFTIEASANDIVELPAGSGQYHGIIWGEFFDIPGAYYERLWIYPVPYPW